MEHLKNGMKSANNNASGPSGSKKKNYNTSSLNPNATPFYSRNNSIQNEQQISAIFNSRRVDSPQLQRCYGTGRVIPHINYTEMECNSDLMWNSPNSSNQTDGFEHAPNASYFYNYPMDSSRLIANNNGVFYVHKNRYRASKLSRNIEPKLSMDGRHQNEGASQRERLEHQITARTLECLVCCERITLMQKIWTCTQCYLILHLACTREWAQSSNSQGPTPSGWRCPACQHYSLEVPKFYYCFCGKTAEPRRTNGLLVAHSCGEQCMRTGRNCLHKCTLLCHPGACPDCAVMVARRCGCGRTEQIVKCGTNAPLICMKTCEKPLNCQRHSCDKQCHSGDCAKCPLTLEQCCYCGRTQRSVPCTVDANETQRFSCGKPCGVALKCGNHHCDLTCHSGDVCPPCPTDVALIKTCPCGKMALQKDSRHSCLDPIPCCHKICEKQLRCGSSSAPHRCQASCHLGACVAHCPLTTVVRCRCGHMDKSLACTDLNSPETNGDVRCDRKCTKKRTCGKHRCNQRCCIDVDHICTLPCNRMLSCGRHRCPLTCHSAPCAPCTETSWVELFCECGANVLYPPIACGTRPPPCTEPCSRPRACGHRTDHTCHQGTCPPCTVLGKRWCFGRHEERIAMPCYQDNFSCGLPCGKPMQCGRHKCIKPCHNGVCPDECKQLCQEKRQLCGHPCNKACHILPCPTNTACKSVVHVTCHCGLQKAQKQCYHLADIYREIEMAAMEKRLQEITTEQCGTSVKKTVPKLSIFKILECTDECHLVERNRRLAISLQIRNPDLSAKLTPRYSEFLRMWMKRDVTFCRRIHQNLTDLVQLAKQSKQKSRSHSFETMNREKRQFVHEYCEHFGCESATYDEEPNRNVVVTAFPEKSWLPSMSLLEVVQRESGQRRVPGPVLHSSGLATADGPSYSENLKSAKKVTSLKVFNNSNHK